ncbi:hypothetical protein SOASR030_37270 [Leminorella grimontii]|uniref:DUF2635 domain-containing protein n=1 Tax=Leminorella grimontii TaxID=82981 RepID=A0AAV5N664_9GAMM|nr:DUF2635 domain-containing protein [Leminorella grimontii]KFC92450.1 hypothetical protein GLGR_3780 [Leminorella grimontii ATCC 33999 = DSM 5078]GKX57615.1 hypothetical protein SOASR030_37270 [Leminorella grimontii]VFS55833.1 Protein of uncharacterised function (DUF2635) [Leminorella grimontii]
MNELHIKPVSGRVVRDPETNEPLKTEGERKPNLGYWQRRLRDGDVVLVDSDANPAPAKTQKGVKS